jgi:TrmH family RNA methyltransferase
LLTPAELDRMRVVLVSPRNPLNIGAAARAMSNFGMLRLRLVNAYDVAFREARSAVGAAASVLADAEEYPTLAEAVADCALVVGTTAVGERELLHPLRSLQEGAPLIRSGIASGCVAIVFGSERSGLRNEDFSHCHWLIRIPTRVEHISMNLGQAVALCLYELIRDTSAAPALEAPPSPASTLHPATALELDRLTGVLLESLQQSGYVKPRSEADTQEKVRRLVRRLSLTSGDAELVLGMLRQILWKLRHGEDRE